MEENKKINYWLDVACQRKSLPEETSETWADWVSEPCIKSPLSPREARAILEVFAYYANIGIRPVLLLSSIVVIGLNGEGIEREVTTPRPAEVTGKQRPVNR